MRRRRPPGKNRTALLLALLVLLVGSGYFAFRWMQSRRAGPPALAAAKTAYDQAAALADANPAAAAAKFEEARLLADKAILANDPKQPNRSGEDKKRAQGEAYWLKARALRERAYAKAAQDGSPLVEALDTSTGERYRAYTAIPDPAARAAAVVAVRAASDSLPDDADLTRDALRVELMIQPPQWGRIERLCTAALKTKPNDARALFFLARYEFDQPADGGDGEPTPADARDPARVGRAREYLRAARAAGSPYWRSVHLEAEILDWLRRTAARRDPVLAKSHQEELRILVLAPSDGAFARAKRGDLWANLSGYDVRGVAAVPGFAVQLTPPDAAALKDVATDTVSIFNRLAADPAVAPYRPDAGEGTADALALAAPALAAADPAGWAAVLDHAVAGFTKTPATLARPRAALKLAALAAALPGSDGGDRTADPRTRDLLTHAVAAAAEARVSAAKLVPLRSALLDAAAFAGSAEVEPQLAALRAVEDPAARVAVALHEGFALYRAGQLTAARKRWESLIDSKAAETRTRAAAALAAAAFDADDPNTGLGYSREVEAAFPRANELSPWDAAWLRRFAGSAEEVALRQATAVFDLGLARIRAARRSTPDKPLADDIRAIDQSASPYTRALTPLSDADRLARISRIRFLAAAGQGVIANKQLAILAADAPADLDVLRTAAAVAAVPKAGNFDPDPAAVAAFDARLADFLAKHPHDAGAKALKLEWLVTTGRRTEAVDYLRGPANFAPDPLLDAAVSGDLGGAAGLDDVSTILAGLPAIPRTALATIAATAPTPAGSLAFRRTEAERKQRLVAAWRAFHDGKFEAAAEGFLAVIEVAVFRPAARTGLNRTLLKYADADADRAAAFVARLLAKTPEDESAYLAAAFLAMRNEEIGEPQDSWATTKTMWAALNRWQVVASAYGVPTPAVAATKARFLMLAARFETARQLVGPLAKAPNADAALNLILCELHLDGPYRDLAAARAALGRAFADIPADAGPAHRLEARLLLASGDPAAARAVCDLAVQNDPRSPTAFATLIEVAEAQGDAAGAMQAAFRWHREQPWCPPATTALVRELHRNGAGGAAAGMADTWLKATAAGGPPFAVAARLALGDGYLGFDDMQAERWFREALEREPANAAGQVLAGRLSERRQNWDAAARHYKAALDARPRDQDAAARLVRVLAEEKHDPSAALAAGAAARALPGRRALPAERLTAAFLHAWAVAALRSRNGERMAEARDALIVGARVHPTDPRLLVDLGELHAAGGEPARAAESLAAAARLATDAASPLTPQARRDTLDRVEAARRTIR